MVAIAMKHMDSNFAKLEKFEGVDFKRWQKKMHFLLSSMSLVYVLTTPIPDDGDDGTVDQLMKRAKWDNDDYVCRGLILKGMYDYLFDIYQNVESSKELWDSLEAKYMAENASSKKFLEELTLVELGSHLRIEESLRMQDSDKPKGNNVVGPSVVNMVKHNNSSRYNDNKGKCKHHDNIKADPNKKSKVTCWKCGKSGHLKKDCKGGKLATMPMVQWMVLLTRRKNDDVAWLNIVNDNIASAFISTSRLNDSILWHARLGHVHYMSKDGLIPAFDIDTKKYLKDKTLDKFKVFKTEVELQQGAQIKRFRTDRGGEYMDTLTELRVLSEAMLTACYLLDRVPNKRNMITPYEIWTKKKPNLNYLRVWRCKAVVRLYGLKLKTLGEKDIECIFVGYVEHSKAFRFYVIEPNDSVSINYIIESRDVIFDENRFSSVSRPSLMIPNRTEDIGGSMALEEVNEEVVQQPEPELRKSKRNRTPKDIGPEFHLYLIKETKDEVSNQHSYCFNVKDDPKTFDEAIKSQDGFKQKSRIDYFDTYAPMARISTIRLLIAMASIHNLILHQMDVKKAFLNGDLDEEALKQCHQKFHEVVLFNGYLLNQADKCVYRNFDETEFLSLRFSMKDMGEADVILGIRIKHESNRIAISQSQFIENVLKKFNYFDCTLVSTPMDIMLEGYTDASWIGNTKDNSSTSGWVFLLGGGAISWASKKQTCIIGSTMESEFVALAVAGCVMEENEGSCGSKRMSAATVRLGCRRRRSLDGDGLSFPVKERGAEKKLQCAYMFFEDEHICSIEFDEKAQRAHT
nr:hypothetical protein [Tanacetum cinerariifolium]